MNCRQKSSSNDGEIINISSMLDVMFILIIFFLVTTTFKEEEIDHMDQKYGNVYHKTLKEP